MSQDSQMLSSANNATIGGGISCHLASPEFKFVSIDNQAGSGSNILWNK